MRLQNVLNHGLVGRALVHCPPQTVVKNKTKTRPPLKKKTLCPMQHLIDNMQADLSNEDLLLELNKQKSRSQNKVLSDLQLPKSNANLNSRKVSINLDKYPFIAQKTEAHSEVVSPITTKRSLYSPLYSKIGNQNKN